MVVRTARVWRCVLFHASLKEDPVFLFRIRSFPRALAGVMLLLLLTLAACGTTFQTTTGSGGPVQAVAAENFWGSIAAQVGATHVHVTSIIVDPNAHPHSYTPPPPHHRTP